MSLVAEPRTAGGDEDVMSGDELTDEESVNDDSSHSFLTQINIFDVVDNFFNPNPPQGYYTATIIVEQQYSKL